MSNHVTQVRPVVRPKLDWDGPAYVASCSCGHYQSQPFAYPGQAAKAGQQHADTKNAANRAEGSNT